MRRAILIAVLFSSAAVAAPTKPAKPTAPPIAVPPAKPLTDPSEPTAALLERVDGLYKALEYDRVIPLAEAVLAREDLKLDQKLEAYRLYGSAKAIVEDPFDAEKPFRMLLRARPEYNLPKDTPPKILSVFRKVQVEEQALAAQVAEVERTRIVDGLKLVGEPPAEVKGGKPLKFAFRLKDPTGAVDSVRLPYRRAGQPQFASLPLTRTEEGDWKGVIPGEFTSDDKGFNLEFYVETLDAKGPLLSVGSAKQPKAILVAPGLFTTTRPPPLPKGVFFTGLALSAALGAATGGVGIAFNNTQSEYKTLVNGSAEVDGAYLTTLRTRGDSLGTATTALLISTGVAAVATAVLTPFTNWGGVEAP